MILTPIHRRDRPNQVRLPRWQSTVTPAAWWNIMPASRNIPFLQPFLADNLVIVCRNADGVAGGWAAPVASKRADRVQAHSLLVYLGSRLTEKVKNFMLMG